MPSGAPRIALVIGDHERWLGAVAAALAAAQCDAISARFAALDDSEGGFPRQSDLVVIDGEGREDPPGVVESLHEPDAPPPIVIRDGNDDWVQQALMAGAAACIVGSPFAPGFRAVIVQTLEWM